MFVQCDTRYSTTHVEAVGDVSLLILVPLSNPGVKSRREKKPWRTTFPDNPSVRFKVDFKLATAQTGKKKTTGLCGAFLVTCFYVFLLHALTPHNTGSNQNMTFAPVHREGARRMLDFSPTKKGDEWRGSLANAQAKEHSPSFTLRRSGFQKTSSASLSSLLCPPDQWIEIPSGLHAIAVVMGHVRYGHGIAPSYTRQGKHGKHHVTHGTLTHRIAEGMHTGKSSPIGPISKGP